MKTKRNGDKVYTATGASVPQILDYIGNIGLLKCPKVAFLCSAKCSAEIILKAYDWATEQREKGTCVISGFRSKIEKDVFHYLLKGNQPIILALARGLKQKYGNGVMKALSQNRLLVISPFPKTVKWVTKENANKRNRMMAELADEIFVAYASKGGNVEELVSEMRKKGKSVKGF